MDKTALVSVLKGAAIAALGALLAYGVDAAAGGALGPYGLILAPVLSIALNAFRKWMFPDGPTPPPGPTPSPDGLLKPDGLIARLLKALRKETDPPAPPPILPLVKPDQPPTPPTPPTPPGPWAAALLAVLLLGGTALADLKITGELKVSENRLVRLTAAGDVDGAALIWDIDREDQADVEEVGGRLIFAGPPGVYKVKLRAIRSKDGKTTAETARATVVIGSAPPVPPGPNPPVPPVPPGPETVLVKDLRAAYAADTGSLKGQHVANLAAVYREVSTKAASPDLKTAGDLLGVLRTAVSSLVPPDALVGVRKRIGTEVSAVLPTDPAVALDASTRAKAADVFGRVASALEAIR